MSEQDKKQKQLDTLKGLMNNANYSRGVGEIKNDLWQDIKSGLVAVPQAGVGLFSLMSGGHVGKFVEDNLWDMQKAQENIHAQKSATAHAQQRQFDDAKGFGAKLGTIVKNPMMAVDAAVESTPSMLAGGVIGRGIGKAAGIKSAALRAGVGEGTIMAGSAAENMRSQNDDGLLTGKEAIASLGTGVIGAGVGYGGSRLAGKLGVGDADSLLAGGVREINQNATQGGLTNGLKGIGKGAVSEGVFEELPQTLTETALDNWANGRALTENMAGNAAMGLAAGATMGGVMGGATSKWTKDKPPQNNPDPSTLQLGYNPSPVAPTGGAVAMPSNPNGGMLIDENGTILPSSTEKSTLPQAVYTLANAFNDYQGVDEPSISLAQNLLTHIEQNGIDVQALTDSTDKQEALAQVLKNADPAVFANADSFGEFVAQNDYINQFRATPSQISNEAVTTPTTQPIQAPTASDDRADKASRGIAPSFGEKLQKPSEKLGLDPNAGALSKSAVVAVDSGASAIGQTLHAQAQKSIQEPPTYQDNNEKEQNFAAAPKLMGKQNYIQNQNERLPTQLMVVEADTLAPSTDNTQNQARDRNRTTSRLQVDNIANNLDPAQLADSTTMTHGSPTITDDGTIIAGNGRTMALKQAFAQGRGEEYRQMLIDKAFEYGLDKTALSQMKNPVLVKSVGNIHPDKLRELALNSNETGTMTQSAFETARADVGRVAKVNLDNLHSDETGNINTPSNKHVINQFVSQFPIEQQNALRQADGTLSKQGLERFENALLLSAYGDNPTTQAILESTDLALKNAIKALASTTPSVAKTKQSIQDGIAPNDDIARDITEALSVLAKLRRDNVKPSDYLAQTSLFGDELSDTGKRLLDFMDKNIRSVVKIRQLLYKYYDNLSKENLNQEDMFGKPAQSKQTRLNHALQELGYEQFNEQNTTANQSNAEQSSPSASPNQSDTAQPTDQTRPTSQTGEVNERPQKGKSDEQGVGRDDGVSLTGQEFGDIDTQSKQGQKDFVQTVKNFLNSLKGKTVFNQSLNAYITINTTGINKTIRFNGMNISAVKMQAMAKLPQLLENAKLVASDTSYDNKENRSNIIYHDLNAPFNIAGEQYFAKIVVRQDNNGHFYYDFQVKDSVNEILESIQIKKAIKRSQPFNIRGEVDSLDDSLPNSNKNVKSNNALDDLAQKQIALDKVDFSRAINEDAIANIKNLSDNDKAQLDEIFDKLDRHQNGKVPKEQENAKRPTTVQPPSRILADTPSDGVGADTNGRTPSSVHLPSGEPSQSRDTNQPATGDDRKRSTGVLSDGDKAGLSRGVESKKSQGNEQADKKLAVSTFVEKSIGNPTLKDSLSLGNITKTIAKKLIANGYDVAQYPHTLTSENVRHIVNRHSDEKIEKQRGQLPITSAEIGKIPDVLANPDYLVLGSKTRRGLNTIIYTKMMSDGTSMVVEEVRNGKKQLAITTAMKFATGVNANPETNPNLYAQNDAVASDLIVIDMGENVNKKGLTSVLVAPDQSQSTDETPETSESLALRDTVPNNSETVNTTKALDNAIQATNQADFSLSDQMVQTAIQSTDTTGEDSQKVDYDTLTKSQQKAIDSLTNLPDSDPNKAALMQEIYALDRTGTDTAKDERSKITKKATTYELVVRKTREVGNDLQNLGYEVKTSQTTSEEDGYTATIKASKGDRVLGIRVHRMMNERRANDPTKNGFFVDDGGLNYAFSINEPAIAQGIDHYSDYRTAGSYGKNRPALTYTDGTDWQEKMRPELARLMDDDPRLAGFTQMANNEELAGNYKNEILLALTAYADKQAIKGNALYPHNVGIDGAIDHSQRKVRQLKQGKPYFGESRPVFTPKADTKGKIKDSEAVLAGQLARLFDDDPRLKELTERADNTSPLSQAILIKDIKDYASRQAQDGNALFNYEVIDRQNEAYHDGKMKFSQMGGVVAPISEQAKVLQGKAVASVDWQNVNYPIDGNKHDVFAWARTMLDKQGRVANNPTLGEIELGNKYIRDTWQHGGGNPPKNLAYAIIKDVLEKGVIVAQDNDGQGEDSFFISAPVTITGRVSGTVENIVTATVHKKRGSQKIYVHAINATQKLIHPRVSSATDNSAGIARSLGALEPQARSSRHAGQLNSADIHNILQKALTYKLGIETKQSVAPISEQAKVLQGKAVAVVSKENVPSDGIKAVQDWAIDLFNKQSNVAVRKDLGEIGLTTKSVKDSIAHGKSQFKFAVFPAIKTVLEKGVLIDTRQIENVGHHYISAPVNIDGQVDIATVLVKTDPNSQRMYIHSVTSRNRLMTPKEWEAQTENSAQVKASSAHIHNILQKALTYKPSIGQTKQSVAPISEQAKVLQGKPVSVIDEQALDMPLTGGFGAISAWATALFAKQGGKAVNPTLGNIELNERSVRDSLAHGKLSYHKNLAFSSVKDVLEKGVVIAQDRKGDEDSFYISAPVEIKGQRVIQTVLVHKDMNTQRMYIHSVILEKNLLTPRVSEAPTAVGEQNGSLMSKGGQSNKHKGMLTSADIHNILQKALTYKPIHSHQGGRFGTTFDEIVALLNNRFGKEVIKDLQNNGSLKILSLNQAQDEFGSIPTNADGFYVGNTAYLIHDNIHPDMVIATFLHELGGHGGLQTLMSDTAYQSLLKEFDSLVAKGDTTAIKAKTLAHKHTQSNEQAKEEYLPYLITLASRQKEKQSGIKRLINRMLLAIKSFVRNKLGISLPLTAQDIVALAEKSVKDRASGQSKQSQDSVRFSQETPDAELALVRKKYKGTEQWLKAPNGEPTNLTTNQWLQVRTPSFKAWFGDWENDPDNASQVLDDNGEPLVVYHGTKRGNRFYAFENNSQGLHFGTKEQAKARNAGRLIQAFLNIRDIDREDDQGSDWNFTIKYAPQRGVDGFVYENEVEGEGDSYIVLKPNQVKSAKENIGTFDPNNDDIRFSLDDSDDGAFAKINIQPKRNAANFIQARQIVGGMLNKPLKNKQSGMVATLSRRSLDKMLSGKAVAKSTDSSKHIKAVVNIDVLLENAVLGWVEKDKNNADNVLGVHRFFAPLLIDSKAYLTKLTIKELLGSDGNRIYSVETLDIEKSSVPNMVATAQQSELTTRYHGASVAILARAIDDYNKENNKNSPDNFDIKFSRMADLYAQSQDATQKAVDSLSKVASEFVNNPKAFVSENTKQAVKNGVSDHLGKFLQFLGRRQLTELYGKKLDGLVSYNNRVAQMDADSNENAFKADTLVNQWSKVKDDKALAWLMSDVTLFGIDPSVARQQGANAVRYGQLKARYERLSDEAKGVFNQAKAHYQAHYQAMHQAMSDRIKRNNKLSDERKAKLITKLDKELQAAQKAFFPLTRFGDYVVVVKDSDGNVVNISRAETRGQADSMRQQLIKDNPNHSVGQVALGRELDIAKLKGIKGLASEFLNDDLGLDDELQKDVINALLDREFATNNVMIKNTAGFSQNARRAYAYHMTRGGHYIAKLRHTDQLKADLERMQATVDDNVNNPDFDHIALQRVVDEMNKRHKLLLNSPLLDIDEQARQLQAAISELACLDEIRLHLLLPKVAKSFGVSQKALLGFVMDCKGAGLVKETTPHSEPQAGEQIFKALYGLIDDFLVIDECYKIAFVLWVIFSHLVEHSQIAPLAWITSPEKQCGKSTLFGLFARVVDRPFTANNITQAVLYRVMDKYRPCLLVDEIDTSLKDKGELLGIINAGYSRHACITPRINADKGGAIDTFNAYGAKVFAGIGEMQGTFASRSIRFNLRRKGKGERAKRLTLKALPHAKTDEIKSKVKRWAMDNKDAILAVDVAELKINERDFDNWEFLLQIASVLGIYDRAVMACLQICQNRGELSDNEQLLADIRAVWTGEKMGSGLLLERLTAIDEMQWQTLNNGQAMTAHQLAKRLKSFGIKSKSVRQNQAVIRGYDKADFDKVWERYLPSLPLGEMAF